MGIFKFHFLISSLLVLSIITVSLGDASANAVDPRERYKNAIKGAETIAPLDGSLFGEQVSLQDGSTSFRHTDIIVKTSFGIPMSIGRKHLLNRVDNLKDPNTQVFGNQWDLDIPYMVGNFDTREGWVSAPYPDSASPTPMPRCSTGVFAPGSKLGPWPYYYNVGIRTREYFNGITINIPEFGEEQLLSLTDQNIPSDGKKWYGTTKSNWKVGCLASIKNGQGEGFTVKLPNGYVYNFDWEFSRKIEDLTDNDTGYLPNPDPWHLIIPRSQIFLYPTEAYDQFGNKVNYYWDNANPGRLEKIKSSDGAEINITYNSNGQISKITNSSNAWEYIYENKTFGFQTLNAVITPDKSQWSYKYSYSAGSIDKFKVNDGLCVARVATLTSSVAPNIKDISTLEINHPSGAKGRFSFRYLVHGTNNTPGKCVIGSGEPNRDGGFPPLIIDVVTGIPDYYVKRSLYEKVITGPGLKAMSWQYKYFPSWSYAHQCEKGCKNTSETTVGHL